MWKKHCPRHIKMENLSDFDVVGFIHFIIYLFNKISYIWNENKNTSKEEYFLEQCHWTFSFFWNPVMHFETWMVMSSSVPLRFGEHTSKQLFPDGLFSRHTNLTAMAGKEPRQYGVSKKDHPHRILTGNTLFTLLLPLSHTRSVES